MSLHYLLNNIVDVPASKFVELTLHEYPYNVIFELDKSTVELF